MKSLVYLHRWLLICVLVFSTSVTYAQTSDDVLITVEIYPIDILRLSDVDVNNLQTIPLLLTATVQNLGPDRPLTVEIDVVTDELGYLGSARKRFDVVLAGETVVVTSRDFDDAELSPTGEDFLEDILEQGVVPANIYDLTVEVQDQTGQILAMVDTPFETTNPGTQLELLSPGVSFDEPPEVLAIQYPLFQWFSGAQRFDLAVYEVRSLQDSPEDVTASRPVYSITDLTESTYLYPNFAETLESGNSYAWQVQAIINTSAGEERVPSDVLRFTVEAPGAGVSLSTTNSGAVDSPIDPFNEAQPGDTPDAFEDPFQVTQGPDDFDVANEDLDEDKSTALAEGDGVAQEKEPSDSTAVAVRVEQIVDAQMGLQRIEVEPAEIALAVGDTARFVATAYNAEDEAISVDARWRVVPADGGQITGNGVFVAGAKSGAYSIVAEVTTQVDSTSVTTELRDHALAFVTGADATPTFVPNLPTEVTLVYPVEEQEVQEPSPQFIWVSTNVDTAYTAAYRVRVWEIPVNQPDADTPAGQPLWEHTETNTTTLFYPANVPSLQDGRSYFAQVDVVDAAGNPVTQSEPVRFSMSRESKIGWELYQAWDDARIGGTNALPITILAELNTVPLTLANRQRILATGTVIEEEDGPWMQLAVPFTQLNAVANLEFIRLIDLPAPQQLIGLPTTASVREKARPLNPAFTMLPTRSVIAMPQQAPVSVAVLEFGFQEAAIREILGDRSFQFHSFRQDKRMAGGNQAQAQHGVSTVRALAENLPDDVDLHLINFSTVLEFLKALQYTVDTLGVQILSCSVSWMQAYDHYDGTSYFAKRIDEILGGNPVFVAAAGNFARSHWEGDFTAASTTGTHLFMPEQDYLDVQLIGGRRYNLLLSWDDWDDLDHDLDLQIFDETGQPIYRAPGRPYASANRQVAGGYENPVERIRGFLPPFPGTRTYRLQIQPHRINADRPVPHFELYVYPPPAGASPEPLPGSSLSWLATTRSVVPVSATDFADGSQGPTNDERVGLDFAADGKVLFGGTTQEGTSFAAPRVAAAYALIFARHPDWTLVQASALLQHVASNEASEPEPRYGWGVIDFDALRDALGQ